ncbi:MAG: allophanate hydrolase [Proteobacteria bacterium]|nr:allophanate hydrolase [Pseudomonadota bacterium]MBU1057373.1 allophanate hydrolase [Pseudomonadota bacterium]
MNLTISNLHQLYESGQKSPRQVITRLLAQSRENDPEIWIHLLTEEEVEPYLQGLESSKARDLPLYGIPFAIKDNIDLAGIPTTAGCPEYGYVPTGSAFVVEQLIAAGAVPLGKTNLDQFATGLVGTRSPYGACKNSFSPEFISGGSSSGSAVAVAKNLCTFALGTDTAGSGRVPAAFNNILGLKPSRGLISTRGVVPACRTLDCVSLFALCTGDAAQIMQVAVKHDPQEPYSRKKQGLAKTTTVRNTFTYGVPYKNQLQFFANLEYEQCFSATLERLDSLGGKRVEIDFEPFLTAAQLLYEGPWVEERTAAVGGFLETHLDAGYPITREIICGAKPQSAVDLFTAMYSLQTLKAKTDAILEELDVLITPTAGTCYTQAEVSAEPLALNTNLGYYTNYMNLLDYCGLAVPAAMTATVPFGVTLVAPAFHDEILLTLGSRLHQAAQVGMGTGSERPPQYTPEGLEDTVLVAVCGAHMQGLPLHYQLMDLDAQLIVKTATAPSYRMYALNGKPAKPGLIRDTKMGAAIEVEVYSLSFKAFGQFTAQIPHPLGMGKLELTDGRWIPGFIAEPLVCQEGKEITEFKGWRSYLKTKGISSNK